MKEKTVDEHLLKVSAATIVLDQPLGIDDEVMIVLKGDVVSQQDKTNHDGTVQRIYTVKGFISFNVTETISQAVESVTQKTEGATKQLPRFL